MSGCSTCGGFGNRHDPIAHGNEPTWITCARCNGDGTVVIGDFDWTCDDCAGDGGTEP